MVWICWWLSVCFDFIYFITANFSFEFDQWICDERESPLGEIVSLKISSNFIESILIHDIMNYVVPIKKIGYIELLVLNRSSLCWCDSEFGYKFKIKWICSCERSYFNRWITASRERRYSKFRLSRFTARSK